MKTLILRLVAVSACLILFSIVSSGQKLHTHSQDDSASIGITVMRGTGRTAVIVVRSAAKVAWKTTKLTGRYVAKPILLKAAPAAGKYLIKTSAKHLLPFVVKMSVL